jgi:hypothetical protein
VAFAHRRRKAEAAQAADATCCSAEAVQLAARSAMGLSANFGQQHGGAESGEEESSRLSRNKKMAKEENVVGS